MSLHTQDTQNAGADLEFPTLMPQAGDTPEALVGKLIQALTLVGASFQNIPAENVTSGHLAVARIAQALTAPGPIGGTTPDTGAFTALSLGSIAPDVESALTIGKTFAGVARSIRMNSTYAGNGVSSNGMDFSNTVGTGTQVGIDHHSSIQIRPNINVGSNGITTVQGLQFTGNATAGLGAATWYDVVFNNLQTNTGSLAFRVLIDDATTAGAGATNAAFMRWGPNRSYGTGTFGFGINSFAGGDQNYFTHIGNSLATANKGAMKVTGYSLTGSSTQSMINLAGTLNTTGSVDVVTMDITNTASGASTNLVNFKVGGASMFNITKLGDFQVAGGFTAAGSATIGASSGFVWLGRSRMISGADGAVSLRNNANNADATLACGAITASGPVILPTYTVATVPSAGTFTRGLIYVSDGTSNKRLAISDGTNWRFPDGNVIS